MKRLLIVVDYQVDFVNGSLGFDGAELLDQKIAEKIQQYHMAGDDVVFTLDTHETDYLSTEEGKNLPAEHCIPSLKFAEWLSKKDYTDVELVGLVSNICVLSNAVMAKAALPNAHIVVDAACTASFDPALHEKALDVLQGLQVEVINR